jgi:hypothetical protein
MQVGLTTRAHLLEDSDSEDTSTYVLPKGMTWIMSESTLGARLSMLVQIRRAANISKDTMKYTRNAVLRWA